MGSIVLGTFFGFLVFVGFMVMVFGLMGLLPSEIKPGLPRSLGMMAVGALLITGGIIGYFIELKDINLSELPMGPVSGAIAGFLAGLIGVSGSLMAIFLTVKSKSKLAAETIEGFLVFFGFWGSIIAAVAGAGWGYRLFN